jgi:hypothetical protein
MVVNDLMNNTQLCVLIENKLVELTNSVYRSGIPKYKIPEFDAIANEMYLIITQDINRFHLLKKCIINCRSAINKLIQYTGFKSIKEKV